MCYKEVPLDETKETLRPTSDELFEAGSNLPTLVVSGIIPAPKVVLVWLSTEEENIELILALWGIPGVGIIIPKVEEGVR